LNTPIRCLECGLLFRPPANPRIRRCPPCTRRAERLRNAIRPQYAGDWKTVRKAVLAARPRCETPDCRATGDLTVDHIIPVSRGGTHAWHNLQVLCRRCNSAKGAR
jgi:5-methylcytosine-specific restriction endonuclease McrA